ncbi:MAG: hypothetical protein ACJ8D6_09825 [Sphingomicrobium sp.]
MSKATNKKPVEMKPVARPSRIRREPAPADNALGRKLDRIDWGSPEWEVRFAIAGIVFFALAIVALVFDIGHFLSY